MELAFLIAKMEPTQIKAKLNVYFAIKDVKFVKEKNNAQNVKRDYFYITEFVLKNVLLDSHLQILTIVSLAKIKIAKYVNLLHTFVMNVKLL
jgi:hypothetical protein